MTTVAKVKTKTGWLFGWIEENEFVLPSGRRFSIDDDGNITINGEVCKVMRVNA